MQLRDHSFLSTTFLTVFVASGCATGGRAAYDSMARDYSAIETHARESRASDEQSIAGPQLDKTALVRAVLNRNPSVESARQSWRAALARYRQAGAYEDPMARMAIAPLSIPSSSARVGYEVEISQRIPLGGKLDAQATLAAAEAQSVGADYNEVRLKLALAASELYDDYFVAVHSLEIHARHLELVTALKQSAIAAYESGHAAAQDSLQAEAELARLEYQQVVYETQRDVAVAQLNALLHRDADAALPPPPAELPLRVRDEGASETSPEGTKLLERRPDIVSAQARVRVAQARIAAADSDYYPDLTVSTSYNSMWDMPEHRWMAGVEVSIPLQRERRHAAVDEASASRAAAESDVQSMTDEARVEIAVATRKVEEARRAVQLYEQRLVPVARDQIEAARSGFITSQNSFFAVIEAEHSLRSAELELQVVRGDLSKRLAELDRAFGRIPGLDDGAAP